MACNDPDIFSRRSPLKQPWKKCSHPVVVQKKSYIHVGQCMRQVHCSSGGKHAGKVPSLKRATNPPHTNTSVFSINVRSEHPGPGPELTWDALVSRHWLVSSTNECHHKLGTTFFLFFFLFAWKSGSRKKEIKKCVAIYSQPTGDPSPETHYG